MKCIYRDRLLKLAKHLESGKLGHKVFSMAHFNKGATYINPCGTAGCAIGECPIAFPKSWKFERESGNFWPVLRKDSTHLIGLNAKKFFGISEEEYDNLFLTSKCLTAKQEAERIRDFVKGL